MLILTVLRKRKVKCDEDKPVCRRCVLGGYVCDGYSSTWHLPTGSSSSTALPELAPLSQPSLYSAVRDESEYGYYQRFQNVIALELAKGQMGSVWLETMPRIGVEKDFVREVMIAFSALRMSIDNRYHKSGKHYRYALRRYGQSLQSLRKSIKEQTCSDREALAACLLMFSFESLHGDSQAAVSHANNGLSLLFKHDWNPLFTRGAYPVEYDLVRAIAHLKCQLMLMPGLMPLPGLHDERMYAQSQVDSMGTVFYDFETAEVFYFVVGGRTIQYIQAYISSTKRMTDATIQGSPAESLLPMFGYDTSLYEIPESLEREYYKYLNDLLRWHFAFGVYLKHYATGSLQKRLILMQLMSMNLYLILMSLKITRESDFDQYQREFQTIVELVKQYLEKDRVRAFTIESNFVQCLFLVVICCRDRALRAEALEVLSIPRQEGLWHTKYLYRLAAWVVDTENFNAGDSADIPEYARVKLIKATRRADNIEVWYLKRSSDDAEYNSTPFSTILPFDSDECTRVDTYHDTLCRLWMSRENLVAS